jgi:hypothetical protein
VPGVVQTTELCAWCCADYRNVCLLLCRLQNRVPGELQPTHCVLFYVRPTNCVPGDVRPTNCMSDDVYSTKCVPGDAQSTTSVPINVLHTHNFPKPPPPSIVMNITK